MLNCRQYQHLGARLKCTSAPVPALSATKSLYPLQAPAEHLLRIRGLRHVYFLHDIVKFSKQKLHSKWSWKARRENSSHSRTCSLHTWEKRDLAPLTGSDPTSLPQQKEKKRFQDSSANDRLPLLNQ